MSFTIRAAIDACEAFTAQVCQWCRGEDLFGECDEAPGGVDLDDGGVDDDAQIDFFWDYGEGRSKEPLLHV